MKIYRLLFLLLLAIPGFGQTHTFPALDTNNTFTGSNTFSSTGRTSIANLNGTLYCDGFAGVDIGAQCNTAYAALPAGGGKLHISLPAATNQYNFSTPMVFNTANKPVILECDTNTVLSYVPTSGNAITFDTGINHKTPTGMIGCTLLSNTGNSATATGINFPNTNGAENFLLQNMKVGSGDSTPWLVTTAAAVSGNVATLTFASSPITAGFVNGNTVRVGAFSGADTYFNGTFTLTGVTGTTVTYALTHANASATTVGVAMIPAFNNCINIAGGASLVIFGEIDKANILGCIVGLNVNIPGQSAENLKVTNSVVARHDSGMVIQGAVDLQIPNTSIDDNITAGVNVISGQVNLTAGHFENAGLGPINYILCAGFCNLFGGQYLDDATTGTQATMFTGTGNPGWFEVDGAFIQTSGQIVTNIFTLSNSHYLSGRWFRSGANLGNDYTNSGSGRIQDLTLQTSGFQVDLSGNLLTSGKVCAGGTCASAASAGSVTAATASNGGTFNLGTDGTDALFRSGGTNILIQPGGNQTFPIGAGTVADVITATSSAFATATTAGTCVQNTTAVTGATTAMSVTVSPVSTPGVGAQWSAFVSSAGNVTINECAVAASAGGTIAFNIRVIQ